VNRSMTFFDHPQEIPVVLLEEFPGNRRLFLKREDLIHPQVSGNKWRKLKYNFKYALDQGYQGVITFGGAFSNHIHATAAAGYYCGVPTVGLIRGELPPSLNPTLRDARNWGMKLQTLSREQYRQKQDIDFLEELHRQYPGYWVIPEGGTNLWALQGCREMVGDLDFHYWCISCGTGGTLAGLAGALSAETHLLGFPALKRGGFLEGEIIKLIDQTLYPACCWQLMLDYHFGGYAKISEELLDFIRDFKKRYRIQLDPVYTGKMLWGVFDLLNKSFFPKNVDILAVHSGGLQGIKGIREKYGKNVI